MEGAVEALELEASRAMGAALAELEVVHQAAFEGDLTVAKSRADAAAAHLQATHRLTTRLAFAIDGDLGLSPDDARAHRRDLTKMRAQYFDVRGAMCEA